MGAGGVLPRGASVERTNSHLDAVETDLLRLAPDPYLRGALPSLVAHVRSHLPAHDPRSQRVEAISNSVVARPAEPLDALERDQVLAAVRAASVEGRREIRRVRSFRNILVVTALLLTIGVAGLTTLGISRPDLVPICFAPDDRRVVCPTAAEPVAGQGSIDDLMRDTANAWDIPVVELVGLLAAALAGAFSVRTIQGTSTPYSLPVAVALLKLPAGALTAVIGLLLMRGGFVPGLSALDSSAQIIAWAIVFGYSQQLLTRFVDQQANTVLERVGGPETVQLAVPGGHEPPAPARPAATT